MPGPVFSAHRLVALCVFVFFMSVFIYSAASIHGNNPLQQIKDTAGDAANSATHMFKHEQLTMSESFLHLYESIRTNISAEAYMDASGQEYKINEQGPWWKEPLRNEILIVDIDTRIPDGDNELWNSERVDWANMNAEKDGGMMSASFMNHFLYSQIHGYDYRFFNARSMEIQGYHNTWVKPHVLSELLESYRFVVFVDADATIQHLELPIEWLFNRWGITPSTSIAMPLDTRQVLDGDDNASNDSKGKLALNTGVVIAQALPHTFKMMEAWKECPSEKQYPGCAHWKQEWSHEQRAFSEYIRWDYNPSGKEIIEIPCDDAMGYPGINRHPHILSKCAGTFLRHHTIDKAMTKKSTEEAMLQSMTDVMHKMLQSNKEKFWIKEEEQTKATRNTAGDEPVIPASRA
ncbi:uncharacterized protein M421DRAFT_56970 [Didymella exigua CBS 183.55]|uniref:Nucleotide-diphospho-sugar transferase domain-containing protein n=1 Tax=Didymella exigua CBS 183.55 TaxID=1150837 RepID=A0A6A5RVF4_9PLEO|nr:uncharacterized protein M421DRAFT_56970 [Didymella exigua CBS 183.55]KAF1931144.1 hypothetical protein M421DRAFT_56970 [Didymella exigua CBS 183.55]